ncbi:serine/threonine-protein kinase/endoribonuclease IRE1-like [Rhinichthys klamathensis goyatoka]|uniref:serine/threonine-protein kinase/endoribonuclease IRE1-like n=1 Tax=Rhinichthys klamathensis goyatoka TaxID=3034132 RepID=UPI0024B5CD22|nr:serine/threonine-protein kinase/endoribonuclease IRE1-like [Rhinichthys klamathensis goyatoka]
MPIADVMRAVTIIGSETYSKIHAAPTHMEKMRELLKTLNSDKAKSALYSLLKDQQIFLVKELERKGVQQGIPRSSGQTSSKLLKIESPPQHAETVQVPTIEQKTEKKQIPRWNKSSKRHGTKLEELLKETDIEKVGNLYFKKHEKYMISHSGSGAQVYIGLSEDGIEVAIKLITKNPKNNKDFENELNHLQDLKLESQYIVRYVTFEVGKDFFYLANRLCEYDLVDYMDYLRVQEQKDKDNALRKIVKEMLLGLKVLHDAGVIHRDIKPRNVLIDVDKRARLADFGISRKLEEGKTTVYTDRAGTRGWEATEILNQSEKGRYKKSSDIQVAGMLTYYILSDGKHPFGDELCCEVNIFKGEYSLDDVRDKKATDLVEWMINKDQNQRPPVHKVLDNPYFWDDKRYEEVIKKLGDRHEVQYYIGISEACKIKKTEKVLPAEAIERACRKQKVKAKILEMLGETEEVQGKTFENLSKLCDYSENYTKGKTFNQWKSELKDRWPDINIDKDTPEDLIGLLRCIRNDTVHNLKFDKERLDHFPDFFISLYRLTTDMGWDCTWS